MIKVRLTGNNNRLQQEGYTKEEEGLLYDEQLKNLLDNPKWYLKNFSYLPEYRVSWKNYSNTHPTIPLKYVKNKSFIKDL